MVLTIFAERKNSPSSGRPSTSSRTVCVRFPCATAAIARVTSAVGRSRSSTSVLIDTSISPHAPLDSWKRVRSRVLPSLPTTCPTRFNSCAICWLAATMELKVSATLPASPVQEPGRRTEKSPSRMVCRPARITLRSPPVGRATATESPLVLLLFSPASNPPLATVETVSRLFFFIEAPAMRGSSATCTWRFPILNVHDGETRNYNPRFGCNSCFQSGCHYQNQGTRYYLCRVRPKGEESPVRIVPNSVDNTKNSSLTLGFLL